MQRLARDWGEAGKRSGLFVIERSELGHGGDDLVGSERAGTGDAGEDVMAPGELLVGGDDGRDLGVERFDVAGDLFEALAALRLEQHDGEVLASVLERSAIAHQAIACVDEFGQLVLLGAAGRPDRRLQRDRHPGEQPGVDAVGFGERTRRLGEASRPLRVELDAGQIAKRDLQRAVVGAGRLIGDPLDLPLAGSRDQRLVALGGVGELAIEPGRMGMAVQRRFGDVDADGLW